MSRGCQPLDVHANSYPHCGTMGGVGRTPPRSFWYVAVFWNEFTLSGKPLLNKMRYISWVMALLEACEVTNNGCHLGFYQELEIRIKLQEMVIFCALHGRWHINKRFAGFLPEYLILLLKAEKTCIFTQNWLDHLLLIMSYFVTIAADHHQTASKSAQGMNLLLLKASDAEVLSFRKKLRKT